MKQLSKIVFALYVLTLLWLVLFKFSFDLTGILLEHQSRSINLIPFWDYAKSLREMIDNFIVFIPFGLLLSVVFKQTDFWRKLAYIGAFSVAVEAVQYILAIGRTDITDVLMNTTGGLVGLALYRFGSKYISSKKLDWIILVVGGVLLIALILLRVLFLKVKY